MIQRGEFGNKNKRRSYNYVLFCDSESLFKTEPTQEAFLSGDIALFSAYSPINFQFNDHTAIRTQKRFLYLQSPGTVKPISPSRTQSSPLLFKLCLHINRSVQPVFKRTAGYHAYKPCCKELTQTLSIIYWF